MNTPKSIKNIYILPYTYKTYFKHNKFHSGIDISSLTQFQILQELGYNVKFFVPFGNLQQFHSNIDFISEEFEQKPNKKQIEKQIIENIIDHKTDLIISNYEFNEKYYLKLTTLQIPILYISHAIPGSFKEYSGANFLSHFTQKNGMACVSEYHKSKTISYYQAKRNFWNFSQIIPDFVLFPQFSNKEDVVPATEDICHISALTSKKNTLLLGKELHQTDFSYKIFTTKDYMGFSEKDQKYLEDYLHKYKFDSNIHFNIPHSDIIKHLSVHSCSFVGNAPYDTFTITSLESLSRGVPLIVLGDNNKQHPALEMLPESIRNTYIKVIRKKDKDFSETFISHINNFRTMTLEDRKLLSEKCLEVTGKDQFKQKWQQSIEQTYEKYYSTTSFTGLKTFYE